MAKNNEVKGIQISNVIWNGCSACDKAKCGETPLLRSSNLRFSSPCFIVGAVSSCLSRNMQPEVVDFIATLLCSEN